MRPLATLRARFGAALPFVAPLVVLLAEWRLLSPTPALADHFQFWAAGRIVASGLSPYDRDSWVVMAALGPFPGGVAANTIIQNLALTRYLWLYPPQTAFALAPFGALPLAGGISLFHLFVVATAIAGVVIAARVVGLAPVHLAFALTVVAISQPFIIGVRDGHPLGLVLLGLTLAYTGARDRRALPLAVGAVLVSLKPHIAVGFAALLLAYLVARREWRLVGLTSLALAAVTLPAELATPFPLAAIPSATDERLGLDLSNLSALSRDLGDGPALALVLAALALGAAAVALRAAPKEERPGVAFAAALAVSLVVSPYAHDYDQLLNVPAAFVGLRLARGSRFELPLVLLYGSLVALVSWVLFFWWPLLGQADRVYQAGAIGALPLLSLAALALGCVIAGAGTARSVRAGTQGSPRDPGTPAEGLPRPL